MTVSESRIPLPEDAPTAAAQAQRLDRLPVDLKADLCELLDVISGLSQLEKGAVAHVLHGLAASPGAGEVPELRPVLRHAAYVVGRVYLLAQGEQTPKEA